MNPLHRVIDIPAPGGPEALIYLEQPRPVPGSGEVLIEVHAAGVNRADLKQRAGSYVPPSGAPTIPGLEVAGTIVACGPETQRYRTGDRVCALVLGGGYAEYCVAPELQCLPIPHGLTWVEAAALPEAVFTVWMSVFEQARLAAGETLLVHGGASGIGTTAIQMASAAGALIAVTAGSPQKCERCLALGAHLAIDYRREDFAAVLTERFGTRGVDVILDMIGAPYAERDIALLASGGRLCYIAADGGREIRIDVRAVMVKRAYVTGATLRDRTVADKGRLAEEIERRVWPWIAQGQLRPYVGLTVPLTQASEAHAALADGRVTGKAVLVVRS